MVCALAIYGGCFTYTIFSTVLNSLIIFQVGKNTKLLEGAGEWIYVFKLVLSKKGRWIIINSISGNQEQIKCPWSHKSAENVSNNFLGWYGGYRLVILRMGWYFAVVNKNTIFLEDRG